MKGKKKDIALKPYEDGWNIASSHHLLGSVANMMYFRAVETNEHFVKDSFAYMDIQSDSDGFIYCNKFKKATAQEWAFVFSTMLVFLSLGLYKKLKDDKTALKEKAYFLFAAHYTYEILGIEECPKQWDILFNLKDEIPFKNETSIFENLQYNPALAQKIASFNPLNSEDFSLDFGNRKQRAAYWGAVEDFPTVFGKNLVAQAQKTIRLRSNKILSEEDLEKRKLKSYQAKTWFTTHYPLLASLVASFDVVEDIQVCQRMGIEIGAVSALEKTIYINPLANLSEQGMRFVIAHEIMHIALAHSSRRAGRDHLVWNLACDFVINNWLIQMNVGIPPADIFVDPELSGKSADEIYLLIMGNARLKKRMSTLKNRNAGNEGTKKSCDMLDEDPRDFADMEDAAKKALMRGMFLHESMGRGDLPAGLIEEIKAINQPPIPWQVGLAQWIAERFPLEESKRSYARPSRRQSSTPNIPRPRYVRPEDEKNTRTFGVIMDTSGSMDRTLLGKCLGAIASYSAAQEVKYIRLIFCDAQPYDEGYVSVDILAQKLKIKGRGGTVLQQAVNYLEHADDFPEDAPILILTDGYFEDDLTVKRDHAYLVPNKALMPNMPHGAVFEFK